MEKMDSTDDVKGTADSDRTELDKLIEERIQLTAQVVSRRRRYPKQCAEYLSNTMEIQLKALKKSSVEMPDPGPYTVNRRSYPKDVQQILADDPDALRINTEAKLREIGDLTRRMQELTSILKIIHETRNVAMYEILKTGEV